jgi:hypothetical protein
LDRVRAGVIAVVTVLTAAAGWVAPVRAATGPHLVADKTDLSFSGQRVGTAWRALDPIRLTNDGGSFLTFGAWRFDGPAAGDFWTEGDCGQGLAPGASCTVVVWRVPKGEGGRQADLVIKHNGTNGPVMVHVWGAATVGLHTAAPDGRVFGIGDASMSAIGGATLRWRLDLPLNSSVLGMAATPTGDGVWLVASDGGIFAFGDAAFYGSTGAMRLNKPIVNMAAAPHGAGYWLVASDGGIFAFGGAPFAGANPIIDAPTFGPRQRATAIVCMPTGSGYWIVY